MVQDTMVESRKRKALDVIKMDNAEFSKVAGDGIKNDKQVLYEISDKTDLLSASLNLDKPAF